MTPGEKFRGEGSRWAGIGYAAGQIFRTHRDSGGTQCVDDMAANVLKESRPDLERKFRARPAVGGTR
jgi:hypothetical protein